MTARVVPALAALVAVVSEGGRGACALARVAAPARRARALARQRLASAAVEAVAGVLAVAAPFAVGARWEGWDISMTLYVLSGAT